VAGIEQATLATVQVTPVREYTVSGKGVIILFQTIRVGYRMLPQAHLSLSVTPKTQSAVKEHGQLGFLIARTIEKSPIDAVKNLRIRVE